ncbi:ribosome biogenesis GTP-binding protein YsxC [Actinobacillus equuli]|nr:ribosome biogenesis GTP-binding protein YsxC [Actinobacillus equuli]
MAKSVRRIPTKRECLRGVVILMDIRHPLKDLDQQMIEWAVSAQLPVLLLLTKADKLSQSARSKTVKWCEKRFYRSKVIFKSKPILL